VAALAALALVALLGACGGGDGRDSAGAVTAPSDRGIFSLRVGDCLDYGVGVAQQAGQVPVLPCADPHNAEVTATWTSTAGEAYDEAAIKAEAGEECTEATVSYVGPSWDSAELNLTWTYMYPAEQAWETGERTVLCMAKTYSGESTLTGSVAGLGV
jgi:hypothetical protein